MHFNYGITTGFIVFLPKNNCKIMKKIELKSRKLLRTLFGCLSFTAVAFVFQACYGMPYDDFYDVKLTGVVTSKTTNLPIKGIKVTVGSEKYNYGITDENGSFDFYASVPSWDSHYRDRRDSMHYTPDGVRIHFLDIDGIQNGHFADTTIIINPARKDEVKINIALREKE